MALRSIRARLQAVLSLCALAVILAGSNFTYSLVRKHLYKEFDHFLADKLQFHQISAVQSGNRVSFRISQPVWERIHDPDDPEFFQFRFMDGRDIYRSYAIGDTGEGLPLVGNGRDALVAQDCLLPNGNPGRCMGVVFTPDQNDAEGEPVSIHLVVARDREEMNLGLARLRWLLVAVGGGAWLISLGFTALIVRRALRPVGKLSKQIDAMPVAGGEQRFELSDAPTEIAPVVDRLNDLMSRVGGAIQNERQFTSDAAHELRNPLAALRSQLELALGARRDPDADEATLAGALSVQAQMEAVVENLLVLARLDSGNEKVELLPIQTIEVLRKSWKPSFELAAERRLKVRWDLEAAPQTLLTSPSLFGILVTNLFDNAASYTAEGGSIEIIARDTGDEGLELVVSNSNPGVLSEEVDGLFQRFRRGDSSASGGKGHAGIGLSLCERIVATLDGKIEASVDREWFRITVELGN